jgi:hypothetical protein
MFEHPFHLIVIAVIAMVAVQPVVSVGQQLDKSLFLRVVQSSDATSTTGASLALDGKQTTSSLTSDAPGSYWLAELGRPFLLSRIELVSRLAPNAAELGGLTLRLFDIDDQVVFQTGVTNPGAGGAWAVDLPSGTRARSVWIGLGGNQANDAGNHRVGFAEVRLFGDISLPHGPAAYIIAPGNVLSVSQSSEYPGYPAANAVDGDSTTFTHTANVANSYWMADLKDSQPIDRVELVNRTQCCDTRMAGLVLRIFDGASNTVAMAPVTNPGLGRTWSFSTPAGTTGRYIRVGLENGRTNGNGNFYVTLGEARALSGGTNLLAPRSVSVPATNNLASFKNSSMVRFFSGLAPASNANDDNMSTETKTTMHTVDGYWEVDLGGTHALYGVRTIGASGIGGRLTNATVRLYDAAHDSVFAKRMSGLPDVFDTDLSGPVFARYVRVGLEDKQRTDPSGNLEWYIGMREVEVFGRPTNEIGLLSFTSTAQQIVPGEPVTLSWQVEDVRRLEIHPGIGSVGASTLPSGLGSITLTPTNPTEYILIASNAAGFFTRAVSVQVGSGSLPVRISEIVADNEFSLRDSYGDSPDWIELRNTGNAALNLSGYGLSDDPSTPMKWIFPATNLAPHATLIVHASGRGLPVDPAGGLHANFQLSKEGGVVLLTAPSGTAMDNLAYPELDADLAYGRDLEGALRFLEPTPGTPSTAASYDGWLRPLTLSHSRGFYEQPFTLTVTNRNPSATVYYSVDGSVPTVPYSAGININNTKSVRAWVTRKGWKPPRIQTQTYLFIDSVITSPVMGTAITQDPRYAPRLRPALRALPSVSIVVPAEPNFDEQEGSVEILWPDGTSPSHAHAGIARFGGSWQTFAKRSFRAKFRARYGDSKLQAPLFNGFDHGVLPRTTFDAVEFRAGNQDMVDRGFYMAARFVEDSMLDMGSLNPHGRFVHLYLNGVYWGQYDAREMLSDDFLADYLGGEQEDYVNVRGNDNVGSSFILGTPEPPNIFPWERVISLSNSYKSVRPFLDVSHLIDFMLLWIYGDCESEFRSAGPLHAGSGFKFWLADADGFLRTSANNVNKSSDIGPAGLFGSLIAEGNSDFKMLLADRIYRHYFNDGALTPSKNDARLAARLQEVSDSIITECARWGYRTPANWSSAATNIRSNLFPNRSAQVVSQLRSRGYYPAFEPPLFNQYGGPVTNGFQLQLAPASGTIYYTMDGNDPRLPGGAVSPQALVWAPGAVTISQDTTIQARVRTAAGQWSALAQPRFLLASRLPPTAHDLLITEIHYHPADSDEYEFVELANAGTNVLDLSGVSLAGGVRYIFPSGSALAPGKFAVVVENASSFAQRYQNSESPWHWPGINVAGQWVGGLDNGGETVSLVASNGIVLSSVSYKTSGDWPERADGSGSSVELRNMPASFSTDEQVRAFIADGRNWTASLRFHGSPGRLDSLPLLSIQPEQGWIRIRITGEADGNYRLEYTDSLSAPNWQLLQAFKGGTTIEISDPWSGSTHRFYRIR